MLLTAVPSLAQDATADLIGVMVTHVIVLFDFIEEMHENGEPLEQALLDAGIVRLQPVMMTAGATIWRSSRWRFMADLCGSRYATRKLAGWASLRSSRCGWCQCSIPFLCWT